MRYHKYRAKRADGFPSKLEAAVFYLLSLREESGEIRNIKRQQTMILQDGPKETRITWKIDFSFEMENGEVSFAEAKGIETQDYKLKLKLWKAKKIARLEIWKGHYRNPKCVEVFDPQK